MAYNTSTFAGDTEYTINCTGDAVVGDEIAFEQAMFSGSFRSPKFAGFQLIKGWVKAESYGAAKQQHTFTLQLPNGETLLIKGRNLYRNGCFRKPWASDAARTAALAEKHSRGDAARAQREKRRASY